MNKKSLALIQKAFQLKALNILDLNPFSTKRAKSILGRWLKKMEVNLSFGSLVISVSSSQD